MIDVNDFLDSSTTPLFPHHDVRNFAYKPLQACFLPIFLVSAIGKMTQIKLPIDASGDQGASGESGQHGKDRKHSLNKYSQDGMRGGDGTGGQCGTSAGTISVRLITPKTTANIPENVILANPIDVEVKLHGSITKVSGQLQEVDTVLKIKSWESMSFLAVGGNGGRGGNGGNGQNGEKGYRSFSFLYPSMNPVLNMLGEQRKKCN